MGLGIRAATLLALGLVASDAAADGDQGYPVVVVALGPETVRIRVAEGAVRPCDSSSNRLLVEGRYAPGTVLGGLHGSGPFCIQHTLLPFGELDWSWSTILGQLPDCARVRPYNSCFDVASGTIVVRVSSRGGRRPPARGS